MTIPSQPGVKLEEAELDQVSGGVLLFANPFAYYAPNSNLQQEFEAELATLRGRV